MQKTLIACLALVGALYAQDCRDCTGGCEIQDRACDAPASSVKLSDAIARLEKNGEALMLAKLQKECGVQSVAELKEHVAAYEKYAPMGCAVSQKRLASLAGLIVPGKPLSVPLSVRVARMSDASLKGLHGIAKTDSLEALVKHIQSLEAKPGCASCVKRLATLSAKLPKAPVTLSRRVSQLIAAEKAGCAKANAALKPLFEAAGTRCCKALVTQIETLEAKAAKGSDESKAKLAKFATMIPAAPPSQAEATNQKATTQDCTGRSECSDCSKCGGCPGGSCPGR